MRSGNDPPLIILDQCLLGKANELSHTMGRGLKLEMRADSR
jgi:hypothetical protein